jgi:DNA-binding transcriptional regulator YhcF (GntR family)
VFAYINGLTNSEELGKQGWHGSKRRLAKVLHVSPSTMNDILNRLEEKAYIRFHNGFILSNFHRDLPEKKEPKMADVQNPDTFS